MVNKNNKINSYIYYGIPQMIAIAIAILLFRNYIALLIATVISVPVAVVQPYIPIIVIAIYAILVYYAVTSIREKKYKELTDRSFAKDRHDFKKSYGTLTSFFTTNNPYKIDIDSLPIQDWHNADGVILCKYKDHQGNYRLVKRDSDANGNLVSFGLPGSGKSTTQAATTAARFNSNLIDGGCGVFAISIKGDLLNFVSGKRKNIKVFTPDKAEGSCHYDPLAGLSEMSHTEQRTFVENLAIIICPDETGENSSFFVNGARDYFCAIALYMIYLHDTGRLKGRLTFPSLIDAILSGEVISVTSKIKSSGCKIAGEYSNSYEGSNEKNLNGIYNHLCKSIRPFNNGALRILFDGQGDCIRPADLDTGDIYIDVPQDKYKIYAPAMSIIISNFLMAFMRRDDVSANKNVVPILFLLDEAVQLNLDFSILSQAMSTLRSKKVSLFLLMQSIAQLEGRYGEAHAREIIDLCAYISVFNAQDPKSRKFFQELVGRQKMLKKSTSAKSADKSDTGATVTEVDEYIFESADFGDLNITNKKTGKKIYRVMVYANGKYILGETTPCYV